MKLSELYSQPETGERVESMLELTVRVYNINFGKNKELFETCQKLKEYAQYVDRIRQYAKEMPLRDAIEKAIEECIKEGILSEFLKKNRAEALEMSWYEYNEEQHIKNEREIAFQEGEEQGKKQEQLKTEEQRRRAERAEQEKIESAKKMLEDGNLPVDKIAFFLGFSLEQILEFQKEMQL